MSDTTLANLEDALRAYVADHPDGDEGAIVTDWLLLAVTWIPEHDGEAHGYWRVTPDRQAIHSTLGLIEEARHAYLANATASAFTDDDA